jgi:hypothetical protein
MPRRIAAVHPVVGDVANWVRHRERAARIRPGRNMHNEHKNRGNARGADAFACLRRGAAEPEDRPEPNLKVEADDAEPVKCFKVAWQNEGNDGLGLPMGQAVELCGGTRSAKDTLLCFAKAYTHPGNGGLGLTLGSAVRLCRTNPSRD